MKLNREQSAVFAVFVALFTVIGGSKTNSPPLRAFRKLMSNLVPSHGLVSSGYPYGRDVWPFDSATSNAIVDRPSTKVPPIPDEMVDTGSAIYRIEQSVELPRYDSGRRTVSDWSSFNADNRGIRAELPFEYKFNGKCYSDVGIMSNGRISLGYATNHRRTLSGLPVAFERGLEIVAPFWGEHLVSTEDEASVFSVTTGNDLTVVWQNLATPAACVNSNTTVICRLESSGSISWYYSPVASSVVSNVTVGIQSGTNGWNLLNCGLPADIASLLSATLHIELEPVGGEEWAVADNDGDSLTNYEEFMLGTDPDNPDTDGDGPDDKWELEHGYPPDIPALPPVLPDSDNDGVPDRWELILGTDPLSPTFYWPCDDFDCDRFTDYYEIEYLGTDSADSYEPAGTNTYDEAVLICEIESSLPCVLTVEGTDSVLRIPWIPEISPSTQKVYIPGGESVSVYLSRDYTDMSGLLMAMPGGTGASDRNSGYWYSTLTVYDGLSWNSPSSAGGTFGPFWAQRDDSVGSGWIAPGISVSSKWDVEYWRLKLPAAIIDLCGQIAETYIWLDSSSFYQGTVYWHSEPPGLEGTGNPLVLNPSDLTAGTYTLYATTDTNSQFVVTSTTVNIRRLAVRDSISTINVDAADTSTHTIDLDSSSYSPDGYDIYSEPPGISGLSFVPADLQPGVAYHVYIWNGICGHAEVTVNNLTLVSETEAIWPEDRSRTDIGAGEKVNVMLMPSCGSTCSWSKIGQISIIGQTSSDSIFVRALDIECQANVICNVSNICLTKSFDIKVPSGVCYAEAYLPIVDTVMYNRSGGGCNLDVYFGPTNVCFENVWIDEGVAPAANVTGWFQDERNRKDHDYAAGANLPFDMEQHNYIVDLISYEFKGGPWITGTMEWHIPMRWWIEPNENLPTNYHYFAESPVTQSFEIQSNGTMTIRKHGVGVTRKIDNTISLIPYGGN